MYSWFGLSQNEVSSKATDITLRLRAKKAHHTFYQWVSVVAKIIAPEPGPFSFTQRQGVQRSSAGGADYKPPTRLAPALSQIA